MPRSFPLRSPIPARRRLLGSLVALFFVALGLFLAGRGAHDLRQALSSRDWPATEAVIVSATFDRDARIEPRGVTSEKHTPRIRFSYTVDGRAYVGERAAFVHSSSEHSARALVDRFPPGARVTAYYDPANPADAVLVRDGTAGLWAFVVFGLAFAAIGAALFKRVRSPRV